MLVLQLLSELRCCHAFDITVVHDSDAGFEKLPVKIIRAENVRAENGVYNPTGKTSSVADDQRQYLRRRKDGNTPFESLG